MSNRNDYPMALIVDDEEINREVLESSLAQAGFPSISAKNGREALQLLAGNADNIFTVLLDRLMPDMDGLEILKKIKSDPALGTLPVIVQTSLDSKEDIQAGLKEGAFYYLPKPYDLDMLRTLVKATYQEYTGLRDLKARIREQRLGSRLMEWGRFRFRTIEEAMLLSAHLAADERVPARTLQGLNELMLNAIEHGNLGITYEEKSLLKANDGWEDEVARRLGHPDYAAKVARIEVELTGTEVRFLVEDQGNGFAWEKYLDFDPERAFDSHGRGIMMANKLSFDTLEYQGIGNRVAARVKTAS